MWSALDAFASTDVADALAKLNLLPAFLPDVTLWSPQFASGPTKIVGPAHTVLMVPAAEKPPKLPQHHVDSVTAGSVVVIASPNGVLLRCNTAAVLRLNQGVVGVVNGAVWGGLMSTRAKHLGAVGLVTNGRFRDMEEQRALGFPIFAKGLSCHGAGGFVAPMSVNQPVEIEGVLIRPGDIVVGDADGVVVVPHEHVNAVVAECVRAKPIEDACMHDLRAGLPIAETFAKHRGK